jgi:hypothetical protein
MVADMDTLTAIRDFLTAQPEITDLVPAERIVTRPYPGLALPAIVIEPLPGAPRQVIQQGDPINEPRFRVHVVGPLLDDSNDYPADWDTTLAVAAAFRTAALAAAGTVTDGVVLDRCRIESEHPIQNLDEHDTHNPRVVFRIALRMRPAAA